MNYALPMIPFFIYYSMFGFQRVGDLVWAFADARGKGWLARRFPVLAAGHRNEVVRVGTVRFGESGGLEGGRVLLMDAADAAM